MSAEALECEVSDVAVILRARTYADGGGETESGEEVGTFDATTRPTGDQVGELIEQAAKEVRARIGQDVEDADLLAFAKDVVALRAAMGVELSYIPEQTDPDYSVYEKLKDLYEQGLASLTESLPDSASTRKGFYSLRTLSDASNVFPTSELLP